MNEPAPHRALPAATAPDPEVPAPSRSADDIVTAGQEKRLRWSLGICLALIALLTAVALHARLDALREDLSTQVDLLTHQRAHDISAWMAERQAEARFARTSTYMPDLVRKAQAGDDRAQLKLQERLGDFIRPGAAQTMQVVDAQGQPLVLAPAEAKPAPLSSATRRALDAALRQGTIELAGRDPKAPQTAAVELVVPFIHSGPSPELAVVMRMEAPDALLLGRAQWAATIPRHRLALWQPEHGDRLSPMASTAYPAGVYPPPPGVASADRQDWQQAANTHVARLVTLPDGAKVWLSALPIDGTPWWLSVEADDAQVWADMRQSSVFIGGTALIVALLTVLAHAVARQRLAIHRHRQLRAQQDEELRHLALYAAIAEGSADLIFGKDRAGRYQLFNPVAVHHHRRQPSEVLGRTDDDLFPPERAREIMAQDEQILRHGETLRLEESWPVDGDLRTFQVIKGPLRDAAGQVVGLFGVLRDITESLRLRQAWEEEALMRRTLLAQAQDAVFLMNLDGELLEANASFGDLVGTPNDEIVGSHLWDWDVEWPEARFRALIAAPPKHTRLESRYRHRDGHLIDVEITASVVALAQGQHYLCACRDIRPRKQAEAALVQSRLDLEAQVAERTAALQQALAERQATVEFTQNITDNVPGAISYWDTEERCLFANRAYAERVGRTPRELIGLRVDEILDAATMAVTRPHLDAVLRGEPQQYERELTQPDGTVIQTWTTYTPHRVGDQVIGVFAAFNDITPVKQAQWQLKELNRALVAARDQAEAANRAKSAFLANMSHEIRTPMNAIIGLTHLMERQAQDPAMRERLNKVVDAARHLLAIINDVLDLSKIEAGKLELERAPFSLEALVGVASENGK